MDLERERERERERLDWREDTSQIHTQKMTNAKTVSLDYPVWYADTISAAYLGGLVVGESG